VITDPAWAAVAAEAGTQPLNGRSGAGPLLLSGGAALMLVAPNEWGQPLKMKLVRALRRPNWQSRATFPGDWGA
jgi:hypothetical protein